MGKRVPITAARCRRRRVSGGRRSRRAAATSRTPSGLEISAPASTGVVQVPPQLTDEEGVAAGLLDEQLDGRLQVRGDILLPGGARDEAADAVAVEPAQGQAGDAGPAAQVGKRGLEVLADLRRRRPVGGDDAHGGAGGRADDVVEQLDRRPAGPGHVVEDQQQRPARG